MSIKGYKELSAQLSAMGAAAGGSALRSAASFAMKPAQAAAVAAAPEANPPYGPYETRKGGAFDPYPKKTYKGRFVAPGFTKRSVAVRSWLARTRDVVKVSLGVRKEAFYAVQFIELGTSKIPKRPWLEPAFRGALQQVNAALQQRLAHLIDRAAKRRSRTT